MENPQHALIEKFLDGSLSPAERTAFESQLAADPALVGELRLHEAARAALELQALLDRRERFQRNGRQLLFWKKWQWKIQDALEAIFVQQRDDSPGRLRWGLIGGLSLATALLVLCLINPGLFFPGSSGPGNQAVAFTNEQAVQIYDTHFQRLDLSGTLGGSDEDSLFQKAEAFYSEGNCPATLEALETLLANPQLDRRPMALLLKGTCQLNEGNAAAALETLNAVPPAAAGPYQHAEWYRALALLKLERADEAAPLLQSIAENAKHRHRVDAQAVLNTGK